MMDVDRWAFSSIGRCQDAMLVFEFFCDHKIEIEMGIKLSSIMQAKMDLFSGLKSKVTIKCLV